MAVFYEYVVANRDCPEGDWKPHVGWRHHELEKKWEAWWVSPWENPFQGDNVSGFPGGSLNNAMPGTWIAPLGYSIIVDSKESVLVEAVKGEQLTTIRISFVG